MACDYCEKIGRNPAFVAGCDESYGDVFAFATYIVRGNTRAWVESAVVCGNKENVADREISHCPMCGEKLGGDA